MLQNQQKQENIQTRNFVNIEERIYSAPTAKPRQTQPTRILAKAAKPYTKLKHETAATNEISQTNDAVSKLIETPSNNPFQSLRLRTKINESVKDGVRAS